MAAGFIVEKMSVRSNALSSMLVFRLSVAQKKCFGSSSSSQEGKQNSRKEKILCHKITTGKSWGFVTKVLNSK